MKLSFKYRFILSFVVLEIIFLSMIAILNFNSIEKNYDNFIEYKKESLQALGKELLLTPVSSYDTAMIDNIVHTFLQLENVVSMKVWDSQGVLLSQEIGELQNQHNLLSIENDIVLDNVYLGKFSIWINKDYEEATIQLNKQRTILLIIIEIIISTALSWLIGHRIANNLNKLTKYSEQLCTNLNLPLPQISGDKELIVLSDTLNQMREKLLQEKHDVERYTRIIDQDVIVAKSDLDGNITYVSQAFCRISGYTKEELLGKNLNILRHPDIPKTLYEDMWNIIKAGKVWSGEIENRSKDQSSYWIQATVFPWFDSQNNKIGYMSVSHDITNKKHIEKISITDGLTHIYNRRHFDTMFPKVINSSKRNNDLVSFLLMDIDHFKQYNDTYGHQMGDEVLIKVAACIRDSFLRADDYCFRLGGEEFGVLFKSDTKEKALQFANTIRRNIEHLHIKHSGNSASKYVTVSMGLFCEYANEIESTQHIYKLADDLLYISKENGRNQVNA